MRLHLELKVIVNEDTRKFRRWSVNEYKMFSLFLVNSRELKIYIINKSSRVASYASKQKFEFLKKLWCCVGGRLKQKFILSNELIKVEWPP